MTVEDLTPYLDYTLEKTHFSSLGSRYEGKVRDVYAREDELILITTDRISAFDHVLNQPIPLKGQVLNQVAAHSFEATSDIVPNHVLDVPDPNVTRARRCEPIKLEFVVRGYLAGHAWREYKRGERSISGAPLPDGLQQNEKLPSPILTPATKAESGHDEDITPEDAVRRGIVDQQTFDKLADWALKLFERGSTLARKQGLILVDTKYEFGRAADGSLMLIDEVHTPDSSRYFYADGYEERLARDEPQRQLSKEFVREWLMDHGFQGKEGQSMPDLPDAFRLEITQRYIELFEQLTGSSFELPPKENPVERIQRVLGIE